MDRLNIFSKCFLTYTKRQGLISRHMSYLSQWGRHMHLYFLRFDDERDRKAMESWREHPYVDIVDNRKSRDFDGKVV